MELSELVIFVAIAEEGSVTGAAKRLGMTQPGASQHLSKLETEVGQALFERRGRSLVLNDFGRLFLGKARELLTSADGLKDLAAGKTGPSGTLKLGLTDASTQTIIPPTLSLFRERYPNVQIKLDVKDSNEIEEGVLRGNYDLGLISSGKKVHPQIEEIRLYEERIDALVSRRHALTKKKNISLDELSKWPLLVYPMRSRTRQIIDDAFHSKNIYPREIIDVYINTAAVKLAEAGMGVALLSESFIIEEMLKHRCVHIRIDGDPFKRAICLIRKRSAELSEAGNCFYEIVMKHSKWMGK